MKALTKISDENRILSALEEFKPVFRRLMYKIDSLESYATKLSQYAEVYCAYIDGECFGMLVMYVNDAHSKEAYISLIGIKKEFEHMGLGTYLLKKATYIAKEHGMNTIRLEVNNNNYHAIDFYHRNGFSYIDESNADSRYMIKHLL